MGADEPRADEVLAAAGTDSAVVLVRCADQELADDLRTRAERRGTCVWQGRTAGFRADLDPGPQDDWVRTWWGETGE